MRKKLDLTGQRYGMLTVVQEVDQIKTKRRWLCQCDCGEETIVLMDSLRSGNTKSCGCYKGDWISDANTIDLTGKIFGKLTVIKRYIDKNDNRHAFWECRCDCGETSIVDSSNLQSGNTQTCGCGERRKRTWENE